MWYNPPTGTPADAAAPSFAKLPVTYPNEVFAILVAILPLNEVTEASVASPSPSNVTCKSDTNIYPNLPSACLAKILSVLSTVYVGKSFAVSVSEYLSSGYASCFMFFDY